MASAFAICATTAPAVARDLATRAGLPAGAEVWSWRELLPQLSSYVGWAEAINRRRLPGLLAREAAFVPTFSKHQGDVCRGVQLHVTQWKKFESVRAGLVLLEEIYRAAPEKFAWKQPPYEYEFEKLPIDCILGTDQIRLSLEEGRPLEPLIDSWRAEARRFRRERGKFLLYR